jgi:hypothetical protein
MKKDTSKEIRHMMKQYSKQIFEKRADRPLGALLQSAVYPFLYKFLFCFVFVFILLVALVLCTSPFSFDIQFLI